MGKKASSGTKLGTWGFSVCDVPQRRTPFAFLHFCRLLAAADATDTVNEADWEKAVFVNSFLGLNRAERGTDK